jgi:hypothetical protein
VTARTLSDGEAQRLRYELGLNVVGIGAEPYIGHAQIISVIQSYLVSDVQAVAYSSAAVTATGSNVITLDSVVGISQGTPLILDCDDSFERVTTKRVVGSTVVVNCRKTHGANFPVEIESGLTMVRCKLWTLATLEEKIAEAADAAGLKQVDEVVFQDANSATTTVLGMLKAQQAMHRRELASLVNMQEILAQAGFSSGSGAFSSPY